MQSINIGLFFIDDDDHEVFRTAQHIVNKLGITNYKFLKDEDEFIDNLDDEIHVCVIDHRLTKQSGLEVTEYIRNKNANTFIIVYTGYQSHDVDVKYIDLKIDGWVDKNKPNHKEKLERLVEEGLATAKKRIEIVELLKAQIAKYE